MISHNLDFALGPNSKNNLDLLNFLKHSKFTIIYLKKNVHPILFLTYLCKYRCKYLFMHMF